ncbi:MULTISPECIES: hypothetical protein [Halorussus]|uniref:hypothetical protein n=1 Tax=Halorussus TaxID=1070314 RepID=UPI0020A01D87|nr:hypothetical protein [Halorussus vallis]USZ75694.1 hypothetical protein NGM07_19980 [Halorussus vallis]USZ75769.1 hypothetical protein NGM07_00215 [Halorussus vallis]
MSKAPSISPTDDPQDTDENWIEEHREEIEREANSDAPDAWVFERLLQSVEDSEDGDSS